MEAKSCSTKFGWLKPKQNNGIYKPPINWWFGFRWPIHSISHQKIPVLLVISIYPRTISQDYIPWYIHDLSMIYVYIIIYIYIYIHNYIYIAMLQPWYIHDISMTFPCLDRCSGAGAPKSRMSLNEGWPLVDRNMFCNDSHSGDITGPIYFSISVAATFDLGYVYIYIYIFYTLYIHI